MYLDNFTVKKYNKTENAAVAKGFAYIAAQRGNTQWCKVLYRGDEAGYKREESVSNYIKALYDI